MRNALSLYRASLVQIRRRSVILLLLVFVGVFGFTAWTSYEDLREHRRFLALMESGTIAIENLPFGLTCSEGKPGGPPPGTEPPSPATPTPRQLVECSFVSPSGEPFGPVFSGDPFGPEGIPPEVLDVVLPGLVSSQRELVAQREKALGWASVFESRERAIGTILGIVFAVVLGSTFFGAEVRWGVWRTLLTHEPRRGRVLASKFAVLWTAIVIMFVVALGVAAGVDAVMRSVLDVDPSSGPSIARLAMEGGWALLSLELYATMAAAFAVSVRTSLAGVAALGLLVGDHLLVSKYRFLRHVFPTQQIAWLLPQSEQVNSGYAWFSRLVASFVCRPPTPTSPFDECKEVLLPPIPHWRASLVIAGWLLMFALMAWAALRARDVPQ